MKRWKASLISASSSVERLFSFASLERRGFLDLGGMRVLGDEYIGVMGKYIYYLDLEGR